MQIKSFTSWRAALPWGLLFMFVMLTVLLGYRVLDQAVTLDHQEQQYTRFQEQLDTLRTIAAPFMKGITKAQLIKFLQQNKIAYFVNEYNDSRIMDEIAAGQVGFYFDRDKLARVEVDQNFDEISRRMPGGSK